MTNGKSTLPGSQIISPLKIFVTIDLQIAISLTHNITIGLMVFMKICVFTPISGDDY